MALLTRSLRWQPMLVVIRRRQWLRRRLRQARRPALTAARSAWLVTRALAAARSSTSLVVQRPCPTRRVVRAVVIWRLRRLVGIQVVVLTQALLGVAAVGRRTRAVLGTSRALSALVLVLVLRILPRLWLAALIPVAMTQLLLPELLQPTLRPSMVWSSGAGSCHPGMSSTCLMFPLLVG